MSEITPAGPADPMRRALLAVGALAPLLAGAQSARAAPIVSGAVEKAPPAAISDFDFLVGRWHVFHRRLVGRLVGSDTWQEFDGTIESQKLLGGQANVDDTLLHIPSGTYRGVALRVFDPQRRAWSIYWVDSRITTIDPPVVGGFAGNRGVFFGDDVNNGKPVLVRFIWWIDGPDRLRWEQALSPDGGVSWETNWTQRVERMA